MHLRKYREFTIKAYSQDLRDRVIELYKTKKYTKTDWIKRYNASGDYSSKQHIQSGRKPRFRDKEKVLGFLLTNPDSE